MKSRRDKGCGKRMRKSKRKLKRFGSVAKTTLGGAGKGEEDERPTKAEGENGSCNS